MLRRDLIKPYSLLLATIISFRANPQTLTHGDMLKILGFAGRPNSVERQSEAWCCNLDTGQINYSIGPWGTRSTNTSKANKRQKHIILMGGSNTFGELLPNKQTISAHLEKLMKNAQIYNLSYRGWGPAHHLALFDKTHIEQSIIPENGTAYYLLYNFHINRVVGNSFYLSWSEGHGPYYKETVYGHLKYMGLFKDQKDILTRSVMMLSKVFRFFGIQRCFPSYSRKQANQTIRIISEIRNKYLHGGKKRKFVVIIPPKEWRILDSNEHYQWLVAAAKKIKLQVWIPKYGLDYKTSHFIDGHLNAHGALIIADKISTYRP